MVSNNISFKEAVHTVVRSIPRGKTLSYKEVAKKAGNENSARAVAMLMSRNYDIEIPCHRVVCSNGTIGGYNRGGSEIKKKTIRS